MELELNTKFGKRKIEVESGRCEGCAYYVNCYGRDISFLEIQGSESYIKYENEKYYTDIYKLCTYEMYDLFLEPLRRIYQRFFQN